MPGLQSLGLPALVLGGTDLYPSHEDFEILRKAATAPGSASLEFPGLNHEYIKASGDGSTTFVAAQVAPAVMDTIAEWITTGPIDSKLHETSLGAPHLAFEMWDRPSIEIMLAIEQLNRP